MRLHSLDVLQSFTASAIGIRNGIRGTAFPRQPELPLRLYELESCPFCRRVREVLTLLNLDIEIRPCPKNGTRFRAEAQQLSGTMQFPLLVDDNTGAVLLESQAIIDHLFAHYGNSGTTPRRWRNLPKWPLAGSLASAVRLGAGSHAHARNAERPAPAQKLHLWSFEGSPYARLVRERLCELELRYVLHNVAKERWQDLGLASMRVKPGPYVPVEGGKRERILAEHGRVQVPYLRDPNTGTSLYESADILDYLDRTYA